MKEFYIQMESIERETEVVAPVRSILYSRNHPFQKYQQVLTFQICFRFDATIPEEHLRINRKRYQIKFPNVIIKRPGEIHEVLERSEETSEVFYFTFKNSAFLPKIPDDFVCCTLSPSPEMRRIFQTVAELAGHVREFGTADRIDLACHAFLTELLLQYHIMSGKNDPDDSRIRRAASYLQLHFNVCAQRAPW